MSEALISARGVTVRFGGLVAVNGVDLDVHHGELVGVIGPISVCAPPIMAISTVWKPMNGLNTDAGSM